MGAKAIFLVIAGVGILAVIVLAIAKLSAGGIATALTVVSVICGSLLALVKAWDIIDARIQSKKKSDQNKESPNSEGG